ncbi:MAG: tetratricopeptide repeat protein [Bacteroidota bacterium]
MLNKPATFGAAFAFLLLLVPSCALEQSGEIPVTTSSEDARSLFLQGRDKLENSEFVSAAALLDQAIGKDPNFALAHLYRAQSGGGTAIFQKHIDKAVELAEKASPGERLFILATKANIDGDRATFKKHLDELMKAFPNDKRVLSTMAGYYAGEGNTKAAAEWYQKVTQADPNYAPAHNLLGYANKTLGNYAEAEAAFKKYIELAPNSPNPPDSYAELLLKMGRFDESIQYYRKALEIAPSFTGALGGIGFNYIHKGDFSEARESFEEQYQKSTQVNGKLASLGNIVYSYLHEWDIPGALKAADRYRMFAEKENPPSTIFAHFMAGWINVDSGNPKGAKKHIDAARKLNETVAPTPAARSANDINLNILECYTLLRSNDLPGAKKQAEKCRVAIEQRNIPSEKRMLHFTLGDLECELGNHAKALEHLDQGPIDNPGVMFAKGRTYERMGDKAKAMEWYKKAANWNWTGLQYALVRARAMKKAL